MQVGKVWDFPRDGGATIKYGKTQIAVFNFASRGEWYATQNMCPHRREFVLSRGMIGDQDGKPKVACPVHKKTFSLESGKCLSGEDYAVAGLPGEGRGRRRVSAAAARRGAGRGAGDGEDVQRLLSAAGARQERTQEEPQGEGTRSPAGRSLRGETVTRPLEGCRVALAEGRQLEELVLLLEKEGAVPIRCPMVSILDNPDSASVLNWLRDLTADRFGYLILMTGEALRRLLGLR